MNTLFICHSSQDDGFLRGLQQPLGIELPRWEGRVIETKTGGVRLLPSAERAKQLFGEDGAQAVAARLDQEATVGTNPLQGMLFPEMQQAVPKIRGRGKRARIDVSNESLASAREATTLDRIHAAMVLRPGAHERAAPHSSRPRRSAGPTSSASPTPCTQKGARRSGCLTLCSWPYPGKRIANVYRRTQIDTIQGLPRVHARLFAVHMSGWAQQPG